MERAADSPRRLLDFRGGGWVLWLASLLMLAIVVWRGSVIFSSLGHRAIGDGRNVESYLFDLRKCLIPRDQIIAGGLPRDGVWALSSPERIAAVDVPAFQAFLRKERRHKFLIPDDPVIGLAIADEAVAYPTRLLAWHQVVNDVVGGVPVAVTYDPLCDSAIVFDRRVGDETLEFGVSGLIYNSNLLLYDRRPNGPPGGAPHHDRSSLSRGGESLWSQLEFRAIAGPAAERGERLEPIAAPVSPWSEWAASHPQTHVMKLDVARLPLYKRTFQHYYGSDELMFPVAHRPPIENGLRYKTPIFAIRLNGAWSQIDLPRLIRRAGQTGVWRTTIEGQDLAIRVRGDLNLAWIDPVEGRSAIGLQVFRFAWYAMQPECPALP